MRTLKILFSTLACVGCLTMLQAQPVIINGIINPLPVTTGGSTNNVKVAFTNNTVATINSIDFYLSINGGSTVSYTWNGILNPSQTDTTIVASSVIIPWGGYTLCVYTSMANSDTACYQFAGTTWAGTPYFNDFETPNFDWNVTYALDDTTQHWQLGIPNYGTLTSAHSGDSCWVIGLNTGYGDSMHTCLYSPFLDFSTANNLVLSFYKKMAIESTWDWMRMEYSTDTGQTWNTLGVMNDTNGINWYNNSTTPPSWTSDWTIGWKHLFYKLNQFNSSGAIQFRFLFTSDGSVHLDGVLLDDFKIDSCNLALTIDSLADDTCPNGNSGAIFTSIHWGAPPYVIKWNGVIGSEDSTGLSPGTYVISVTDSNGCSQTETVTINLQSPLTLSIATTNITCNGVNDGLACALVSGGTPAYTYLWSNGVNTACANNLTVGLYTVTVTDVNACSATTLAAITQPPLLIISIPSSPIVCYNDSVLFCISNYDSSGCTATATVTVNQDPQMQISFSILNCPSSGMCDGAIDISLAGGTAPYVYILNGAPIFSLGIFNAICDSSGYTFLITDANGCTLVSTIFLTSNCNDVWPGDANHDQVADNTDLLAIGIGYGTTGPVRPGATINWVGQAAPDWTDSLANNANYKHVDCNGDGIIDANDTTAIIQNYGMTHSYRLMSLQPNPFDPPLYFDIVVDTVGTDQVLSIPLNFGTQLIPADSIYGLAFTVNYDTSLVKADSINISFSNSWLGTLGNN
jgi:hypothetical protein